MSRYRICAIIAMVLCAVAVAAGKPILCWAIVAVFSVLIGLGVALPHLRFFGPFVCHGNSTRREVALTFDDGPDGRSTPALLDLLKSENISATFFCIGKRVAAEREPRVTAGLPVGECDASGYRRGRGHAATIAQPRWSCGRAWAGAAAGHSSFVFASGATTVAASASSAPAARKLPAAKAASQSASRSRARYDVCNATTLLPGLGRSPACARAARAGTRGRR